MKLTSSILLLSVQCWTSSTMMVVNAFQPLSTTIKKSTLRQQYTTQLFASSYSVDADDEVAKPKAGKKKVIVLGGDGFCGWPTSLYLSDQGHDIVIVDNLSRRNIDIELGCDSLTPIQSPEVRAICIEKYNFHHNTRLGMFLRLFLTILRCFSSFECFYPFFQIQQKIIKIPTFFVLFIIFAPE